MVILTPIYVKLAVLIEDAVERIYETLRRIKKGEDGVSLVEYALLIAGVTIAVLIAILSLYDAVRGRIQSTANLINSNPP